MPDAPVQKSPWSGCCSWVLEEVSLQLTSLQPMGLCTPPPGSTQLPKFNLDRG